MFSAKDKTELGVGFQNRIGRKTKWDEVLLEKD